MGGAPATLQALWWAARWLAEGRADRLLVLGVEAFHEVRDLFGRARRLFAGPLLEGAACLLLEPGAGSTLRWASALAGPMGARGTVGAVLERVLAGDRPGLVWSSVTGAGRETAEAGILAARGAPRAAPRLGEALAMGPLLGLGRAQHGEAPEPWLLTATWRSEYAALLWSR
jgi:hypothetical protein